MATNKIQTGLRLHEATYEKARILSTREQRSLNNFIVYIVQRYIEDYENKNGPIQLPEQNEATV